MPSSLAADDVHAVSVGELFLKGADTYSIPLYQRDYTWGEEQIHRLIYDVLDEAEQVDSKDYFLGNLVVAPPKDTGSHAYPFDVIDGQQRLTTLYILLISIRSKSEFADLIGQLQPLTYESREKATRALRGVVGRVPGEESEGDSEDSGIVRAHVIINQLLQDPGFASRFLNTHVISYLLNRVRLVRMPIDRSLDLNRYFEVMNTRGAQLSPVDIVKARLLRQLPTRDRDVLNRVWTACSDMSNYVAMTVASGDTDLRSRLFGEGWNELPPPGFQELRAEFADTGGGVDASDVGHYTGSDPEPMTLCGAINFYSRHGVANERDDDEENERFTSQITFPTFLLHVLAVRRGGEGTDHEDRQLDDKALVRRFEEEMPRSVDGVRVDTADSVRSFTTDLLRIRVLFDRYILKRDSSAPSDEESSTDSEPGDWSLLRLARRSTKDPAPDYQPTFVDGESGTKRGSLPHKILLLQSALRITYTSPSTMHWMTDVLRYVTARADHGQEVTAQGLLNRLDAFALGRLAAEVDPEVTKVDLGDHGFPLGFGIHRLVFTYLDYLLVEKLDRWDFKFSYRTSIEHFSPVTVNTDYLAVGSTARAPSRLDYFGNLALVTVSSNSSFSNDPAPRKARNTTACAQSLKLSEMAEQARKTERWDDADIEKHHVEMTTLLRDALARRPQLASTSVVEEQDWSER